MKVLVITDLCGGFSITLPEKKLYKGLKEMGVKMTVVTHYATIESEDLEKAGIQVIYIPIFKKFDFKAVKSLRQILTEGQYDILYITFGKGITNGLLAARNIKIKIIGYFGSLNVHWHDPTAYLSFLNPRLDRIVCNSDGVLEHFVKQGGKRLKNKCIRIYKGYDSEWIQVSSPLSKQALDIPEDAFVICCIANVRREKGIPYLINATRYLPDNLPVYFVLIGKGMDSTKIKRLVSKSSYNKQFRIFGFINEIFPYTAMCDIYVQPSITEGLGRSIIEAMFLQKPVILSGRGGAKELVDEGVNGFVVPAKSSFAIAEKINYCFNNREILPAMGEKSMLKVKKLLDPKEAVEKTYRLFCEETDMT